VALAPTGGVGEHTRMVRRLSCLVVMSLMAPAVAIALLPGLAGSAAGQQSDPPVTLGALARPADTVSESTTGGVTKTLIVWDIPESSALYFAMLRIARRAEVAAWPAISLFAGRPMTGSVSPACR